jgi:uncharacterized protein YqgQ
VEVAMSNIVVDNNTKKMIEMEVKLHINQRLYEEGIITEEMYYKAKEIIIKSCKRIDNVV